MDNSYQIKRIQFHGREVPIFLQNFNGPCPLLAIANILSLRNQLQLPEQHLEYISTDRLIALIASRFLDANASQSSDPERAAAIEFALSECFEVMERLATGLDVNVKFHSIYGFEATKDMVVFDLLDISLVHGWLVDPADREAAAALKERSYNEVVEALLAGKLLEPCTLEPPW